MRPGGGHDPGNDHHPGPTRPGNGGLVSAPLLLTALVVGVLISLFQAATQINEMTLSFVPKLLALVIVLLLAGPWMLELLIDFTRNLMKDIPNLIG